MVRWHCVQLNVCVFMNFFDLHILLSPSLFPLPFSLPSPSRCALTLSPSSLVPPPFLPGKEAMSATVPIRPGYPDLPTLDSLFNEGAVSFAKLAAEAARKKDDKPHQFDFGVSPEDVIHFIYPSGNKQETRGEKEEKGVRKTLLKKEKEKHRKSKLKPAKAAETKKSSMDDIDESLDLLVPVKRSKSSETGVTTTAENGSLPSVPSSALPSKHQPPLELSKPTNETPVAMEPKKPEKGTAPVSMETSTQQPTVSLETKLSEPIPGATVTSQEEVTHQHSRESRESGSSAETKGKVRKTARDKFRQCENCNQVIHERIQLCSGCKKVAYCNVQCQKTHWKQHKKTCSYALKKEGKASAD